MGEARRIPFKAIGLTGGAVLLGGSLIGLWSINRAAGELVDHFRPMLESSIGEPLGHPVKIGPYRGLRPWGFAIGPTRILPGPKDRSEVSLQGLTVTLDPLASLRQWQPVLGLRLEGAQINLRRNANGQYWVPGAVHSKGSPPNLGLRYHLAQPADIRFEPIGQRMRLTGRGSVQLRDQWFTTAARLQWLDRGGSLAVEGRGRWDQPELALRLRLKDLKLERLAQLTSPPAGWQLRGRLGGDVQMQLRKGQVRCDGGLRVLGMGVTSESLSEPFRSDELQLSCRDDVLQLADSRFSFQNWGLRASGTAVLNRSIAMNLALRNREGTDQLALRIDGPWAKPRWHVAGRMQLPDKSPLTGPLTIDGQLTTPWGHSKKPAIRVDDLRLQAQGLRLRLLGEVVPDLKLRSTELIASPEVWQKIPALAATMGSDAAVTGSLLTSGSLQSPGIDLRLSQANNPLLERWDLQAGWSMLTKSLVLKRFSSPKLKASAQMPLSFEDGSLRSGDLQGGFEIRSMALDRLTPVLNIPIDGTLSARGRLDGPLDALRPNISIALNNPRVGAVTLPEQWQGRFQGQWGQGAALQMASFGPAVAVGSLQADLGVDWWPTRLSVTRQGGVLSVIGTQKKYRWTADRLVLDGLQVAIPPQEQFEAVYGEFSGQGQLALDPLDVSGSAVVDDVVVMGVGLNQISLQGQLAQNRFKGDGELVPPDGSIRFQADGVLGGALRSRADAEALSVPWLLNVARQLRGNPSEDGLNPGRAEDLGALVINTFGGSLDGQLKALAESRDALAAYDREHPQKGFDPKDLLGRVDAVIKLNGKRPVDLNLDLQARGHLWIEGDDSDRALQLEPFEVSIDGPLQGGQGRFSIEHLPMSLLALLAPLSPLQGAVGISGLYRLDGEGPLVTSDISFDQVKLGKDQLLLDRSTVILSNQDVQLDLALRSSSSVEPITIRGTVPLKPDDDLDVQVESHGDALAFLTQLVGEMLQVKRGTTDLRLILRGTLEQPQANGFLVVKDGDVNLSGQDVQKINAALLFDFNRLEVQKLEAQLASGGTLRGFGAIGLFQPRLEDKPLTLELNKGRIRQSMVEVNADARVTVGGALQDPVLGGEITLNHGVIRPRESLLSRVRQTFGGSGASVGSAGVHRASITAVPSVSLDALIEENWDFEKPLVLLGPGAPVKPSAQLKAAIPNIPKVRFENLRLTLGPDLAVRMPPLINFRGGGQLLLNGPLDPSLEARGLIRLNRGRISLFSTTFRLDHQAPNVAVFTPRLGLIPYVDIAMKSQVSDSVRLGLDGNSTTANVFETNGMGLAAGGGQLRLVKVTVQATGRADRLMSNLSLRSSPPMSKTQLLSLIGGNSLAGLSTGGAGAALATVVGQSLLSPVLGTLTDVMGERLQVALYPTYVTPDVKSEKERTSGMVPPKFALVTEIGVDVSDRFDFSVMAAPNNSDVPPQASVTYQLNPNTSLSGSVDSNGTWQSQLRVFFRF